MTDRQTRHDAGMRRDMLESTARARISKTANEYVERNALSMHNLIATIIAIVNCTSCLFLISLDIVPLRGNSLAFNVPQTIWHS